MSRQDGVQAEFGAAVNMTASELERWLDTAESKEVGQRQGGKQQAEYPGSQAVVQRLGSGQQVGRTADARAPPSALDGTGNRHCGHDGAAGITYWGRHAGHAGLAFGHALRPAPPADFQQGSLAEYRLAEDGTLDGRISPCGQHLRARSGGHR